MKVPTKQELYDRVAYLEKQVESLTQAQSDTTEDLLAQADFHDERAEEYREILVHIAKMTHSWEKSINHPQMSTPPLWLVVSGLKKHLPEDVFQEGIDKYWDKQ